MRIVFLLINAKLKINKKQCEKSDEITKKVSFRSIYFAKISP